MNIFKLSWSYTKAKPLNTTLNITLFAFGIAIIIVLLLFSKQAEQKLNDNAEGIDLVIGAKGSPLQLILCNIFHVDFPTGNIPLKEAESIIKNRFVKNAIPLALGDSYRGYRIVGSTHEYTALYEVKVAQGALWSNELEATVGATAAKNLNLSIGDEFASQHGLSEDGYAHDEAAFTVVGILEPSNTVIDNLILTNVQSVWKVHESHDEEEEEHVEHDSTTHTVVESNLIPGVHLEEEETREVTSLLIQYRSPMAAVQFPRYVNANSNLQAASPAFETARLFSLIGIGIDVIRGFAYVIIFIAALSIFIALYNSLKERKYDLAIMRSMGGAKGKLFLSIIIEGAIITCMGCGVGLLLGHFTIEIINNFVPESDQSGITGKVLMVEEIWVLAASITLGVLASIIPAVGVFRTDVSRTLSQG
ncbi:MAG: FtsX-like permease family protein [Bacteroidota bacterium]